MLARRHGLDPSQIYTHVEYHRKRGPITIAGDGWSDNLAHIFWDGLFNGRFPAAEIDGMITHELGHWATGIPVGYRPPAEDIRATRLFNAACRISEVRADRWAAKRGYAPQMLAALRRMRQPGFWEIQYGAGAILKDDRGPEQPFRKDAVNKPSRPPRRWRQAYLARLALEQELGA